MKITKNKKDLIIKIPLKQDSYDYATKKDLLPYNAAIQVCPECGKLDVYLNDGHICDAEYEEERELNMEYYD